MPTVSDILRIKGQALHTIEASHSVLQAVQVMNDKRIGAVLVQRESKTVGIFTERDVLTRVVARQLDPAALRVEEVMTREMIFCGPFTELGEVAGIMRSQRIRHLPVRDVQDQVVGMISIGDVNAYYVTDKQATIDNLSDYICGRS